MSREEETPTSAMAELVRRHLGKSREIASPAIAGLPLVELPAKPPSPLLAIVISGDGGWRDLDRRLPKAAVPRCVGGWLGRPALFLEPQDAGAGCARSECGHRYL